MRRPAARGGSTNCAMAFLDDLRNLRANAVMIIGVLGATEGTADDWQLPETESLFVPELIWGEYSRV